jgi:UDP-N-acetylglucosamine--N-acetylmuramyl-(pentapeptide) pyrophosphoryl-undecaprenol N-acetylglucosamine transferase
MKKTILFTGGHHTSALSIAKITKKEGFNIVWVGHKYAASRDKSLSGEYQEVTGAKIEFYSLKTGRFYRTRNPLEFVKIFLGFLQAFSILIKTRPGLIVSFGGYLSVPIVISGWILGIPSITHEQTVVTGWATKAISPFVKKVLLTHASSINPKFKNKSLVVGLPLDKSFFQSIKKKYSPPMLFVTAGKQGSHIINEVIFQTIPQLIKKYTIIHQTGGNSQFNDFDRARRIKKGLSDHKNRYLPVKYVFESEFNKLLRSAKIIISRSGAHTAYKISFFKKPNILIPIPWVSHNEQYKNAEMVSKHTPTIILDEKDVNPELIIDSLEKIKLKIKPQKTTPLISDANEKILKVIHEYI